jgi:hypothetical protein
VNNLLVFKLNLTTHELTFPWCYLRGGQISVHLLSLKHVHGAAWRRLPQVVGDQGPGHVALGITKHVKALWRRFVVGENAGKGEIKKQSALLDASQTKNTQQGYA